METGRGFRHAVAERLEHANPVLLSIGTVCLVVATIGQGLTVADTGFDETVQPWQRAALALAGLSLVIMSVVVGSSGTRPTATGFLGAPPFVTPRYVERPELSQRIIERLAGRPPVVCVAGMGGTGKSTLAAHVVRDRRVRRVFRHGIVWLKGDDDPLVTLAELAKILGERDPNFISVEEASDLLNHLLDRRRILIVLDNVWDPVILEATARLGTTVLFTTRIHSLAQPYRIIPITVRALTGRQAREMLSRWVDVPESELSDDAFEVCRLVKHLALGVAMTAAMVARGRTWSEVAGRIRDRELDRIGFDHNERVFPHASLQAAIEIGIDDLGDPATLRRYAELAVFTGKRGIPRAAVEVLWSSELGGGLTPAECADLLDRLVGRSLVETGGRDWYWVHDLQLAVLTSRLGPDGVRDAHRRLVEGYRTRCLGEWARLPDDGYSWAFLVSHLAEAGLEDEVNELLTSTEWIGQRIASGNIFDLLSDFRLARAPVAQAVQDALGLSWRILARDATQLHTQVIWRLRNHEDPLVREWIDRISTEPGGPWIRPLTHSSLSVASPDRIRHNGWIEAVAVTPDGTRAITGGGDTTIRAWDLHRPGHPPDVLCEPDGFTEAIAVTPDGRSVVWGGRDRSVRILRGLRSPAMSVLGRHDGPVRGVAVTPDGARVVSGGADRAVLVWSPAGTGGTQLGHHEAGVRCVAVTADGRHAVSGGDDQAIWTWDLAGGTSAQLGRHTGAVRSVAAGPGQLVVSGGDDGAIRVWDLTKPGASRFLGRHEERVQCVTISPDGRLVVSCGDDHTVRVWALAPDTDLPSPTALWTCDTRVFTCAVTADGTIAAGDKKGYLHVLSLENGPIKTSPRWRDWLPGRR